MPLALKRALWFAGLYLAGVGALAVIALMIRASLGL